MISLFRGSCAEMKQNLQLQTACFNSVFCFIQLKSSQHAYISFSWKLVFKKDLVQSIYFVEVILI